MKIGIIGIGKLSRAFYRLLTQKGADFVGFFSDNYDLHLPYAQKNNTKIYTCLKKFTNDCNIIFIAVPDDAIYSVANRIISSNKDVCNKFFGHFSAVKTSDLLECIKNNGGKTFSLHPAVAISGEDTKLKDVFWTYEGEEKFPFLSLLGINPFVLSKEEKPIYHCALTILSNYMVTLYSISEQLLSDIGINNIRSKEILLPLINSVTQNLSTNSTAQALTGPISRGDYSTITAHLCTLADYPEIFKHCYASLGQATILIANETQNTKKIKELLEEICNI